MEFKPKIPRCLCDKKDYDLMVRLRDYKGKFEQLFDIYAQLELIFPDVQTFAVLQHSNRLKKKASVEARDEAVKNLIFRETFAEPPEQARTITLPASVLAAPVRECIRPDAPGPPN